MTDQNRIRSLTLGWAGFGLALFGFTYRLWIDSSEWFPHIPLLAFGSRLPPIFDIFGFGIIVLTLIAVLTSRRPTHSAADSRDVGMRLRWQRSMIGVHVVVLAIMVIANQHRLQPWAYLSGIMGCVIACSHPKRAVSLLRIVLIGVYLHSAISKFDFEFAHGMGQSFLRTLMEPVGADIRDWSATARSVTALVFPITELMVAVGLTLKATRKLTVWLAVAMHAALLFVLGPWGMGQQPAVLIWNGFFIWVVVILFSRSDEVAALDDNPPSEKNALSVVSFLAVAASVLLPFLEPIQRFDHWPSWGLYAPRNSRAVVFVEEAGVEKLPASFQAALLPTRFEDPEFPTAASRLSLNRLSLEALRVPLYPQDRFQLGVALAIAERYELGSTIHVEHQGVASRRFGDRERTMLNGMEELKAHTDQYRLNARQR